jgi:hypothetical protein
MTEIFRGHSLACWFQTAHPDGACTGQQARNLVSAVPIMFFGVPASPLPGPWNWQPAVLRVLGPFGPFGAATNADINGIFFPQASQAQNLWVQSSGQRG